jgi:hypothetical protein
MKQREVEQLVSELRQFSSARSEIDTTYVRADGNGYQVRVQWAGRVVKLGRFSEWAGIKQAWQALNERR